MAQAVTEMLQGVALIGLSTVGAVILAKVGISRLFR